MTECGLAGSTSHGVLQTAVVPVRCSRLSHHAGPYVPTFRIALPPTSVTGSRWLLVLEGLSGSMVQKVPSTVVPTEQNPGNSVHYTGTLQGLWHRLNKILATLSII
jgi:hypothetical protein